MWSEALLGSGECVREMTVALDLQRRGGVLNLTVRGFGVDGEELTALDASIGSM